MKSRLGKARAAFSKLRKIWKSSQLKLKTKLKFFRSNVIASLLFGCETWRMTNRDATIQTVLACDIFRKETRHEFVKIFFSCQGLGG